MLRAALYRPATAESSPADMAAAARERNACQPEPGTAKRFTSCETCDERQRCIRLVRDVGPFALPECNQALIELQQAKRADALPARCIEWLRSHGSGTAAELSRNLRILNTSKTSTALQRLCERGEAYYIGDRHQRRYYPVPER